MTLHVTQPKYLIVMQRVPRGKELNSMQAGSLQFSYFGASLYW